MAGGYTLVEEAFPSKHKIVKNQVSLLEKASKKFGDIPKIFGAFKDRIGIEVEAENVSDIPNETIYWSSVPDGSLKNAGNEFVSCPVGGHNIDYALYELREILKNQKIDWSHRTSIHVHVGVGDLTVDQLQALVSAYAAMEKLFFRFVADHRRGNPYCYYLTDCDPSELSFGDHHMKYCALNVGSSISEFNTVEFRHMQGTGDFRQIRRWIMLIIKLVRYIRSNDGKKIIERVLNLNTSSEYHIFVKEIFDTSFKFFAGVDFQREMEEGVLWAKVLNVKGEL